MYTGKGATSVNGLAYSVVMHLLEDLQEEGRVLYVDNYYTSPILFKYLYEHGTYASGTVRVNRKQFPVKELDEDKMEKGEKLFLHHGVLTAGKWKDKRDVYFLSTLHCDEMETINRRTKGGNTESVIKPKIVTDYNQHMSGVDIADGVLSMWSSYTEMVQASILENG